MVTMFDQGLGKSLLVLEFLIKSLVVQLALRAGLGD